MRGFGLILPWRIDGIRRNWKELYRRYIEPYPCPATKPIEDELFMPFTICNYHSDVGAGTVEGRAAIKKDQTKCPDYPKPNFFLDGYCYHYRPGTGHCDLLKKEKDGDENKS